MTPEQNILISGSFNESCSHEENIKCLISQYNPPVINKGIYFDRRLQCLQSCMRMSSHELKGKMLEQI